MNLEKNPYLCPQKSFALIIMEFIQTLGKGIAQGFSQFITNDLSSYVPLFIIAAVLMIGLQIKKWLQNNK